MAAVRVYSNESAGQIFIARGTVGAWPFHCLQAVGNGDGTVNIRNKARSYESGDSFFELANVPFADLVNDADVAWGVSEAATVDALNAVFVDTGGSSVGVAPVFSAATAVAVTTADAVNYSATAVGAVGWEWGTLPAGLAVSSHNPRNLVGTFTGGAGSYPVSVTAVNYYGSTTSTVTFTVTSSFGNTRSLFFEAADFLSASATSSNPFYRASNGAGAGDAWSASVWFKPGTSTTVQTILSFGGNAASEGKVNFKIIGGDKFRVQYGSSTNLVSITTPDSSLTSGQWHNVFVTYDGGTTGVASGSVSDYYGRFGMWLDGVAVSATSTNTNYGWDGGMPAEVFLIGEKSDGGQHLLGVYVDEVALWSGDESANVAAVYNSGVTHDLSLLASSPGHWWRMGDGDTYPTISDAVGSLDFTMSNMTAADISTDAP